jgi:hypothetical protein
VNAHHHPGSSLDAGHFSLRRQRTSPPLHVRDLPKSQEKVRKAPLAVQDPPMLCAKRFCELELPKGLRKGSGRERLARPAAHEQLSRSTKITWAVAQFSSRPASLGAYITKYGDKPKSNTVRKSLLNPDPAACARHRDTSVRLERAFPPTGEPSVLGLRHLEGRRSV